MEFSFLGRTGVRISNLCLGTMSFGSGADKETSAALFKKAREYGINVFDCANVYNGGESERIVGDLLSDCRDEIVLTTKAYFPTTPDVNSRGLSRYHLIKSVEESLKRLRTDRIDLFFLHRYDDCTDLEETWRAIEDLVRSGKILYPALSNFSAWQGMKSVALSEKRAWARPVCFQPMYNLAKRQAEVEIFPMCQSEDLAVMPYSPTGGGLLTGKYGSSRRPQSGRLVDNQMYGVRYGSDKNYQLAELFCDLARSHGHAPASLAIAWVAAHPAVTAPIIGTASLEHLDAALASTKIGLEYNSELYKEITALSETPPPATDRNEEVSEHNYGKR